MNYKLANSLLVLSLTLSVAAPYATSAQNNQVRGSSDSFGVPKSELPSSEPKVPPGVPRGPKVITNPTPARADKLGATQVHPADGAGKTVDDSPQPKLISVPSELSRERYMVRKVQKRKTMAIALGGGGARGAAHIGVLRVLEQNNIPIDYIVGNSMGSVVGGSYAAGVSTDKLQSLARENKMRKAYMPGMMTQMLSMPVSKLTGFFRHDYAGVWSGMKFQRYLESYLPPHARVETTKIPFSAVATNLKDGEAYRLSEGNLATAIRASCTITPLLRPVKIGNKAYVDGGVRANLPASAAKDTGADVVVAVLVDEPLHPLPDKTFYHYKGIANRLADVVLAVTDEHQLQFADVIINPDVSGIPMLSKKPADYMRAIKAGEEAAWKAIPAIRQKMGLPANAQLVGAPVKIE